MKHTFPLTWRQPAAALAAAVLAAGPILAHGQLAFPPRKAQSAPLTLLLSGPAGEHSSLVYAADSGWRMQPGWNVKADAADGSRLTPAALATAPQPPAEAPALVRPLTVFLDGPTGFTFVYVADEGWKFVGQIANPGR
ncbi:hypothetical protein [Variovorax soli]|uniref:Uncharacterized protein n=1 Tax=Variovorax soli TaxID=376815 RepID=A0ABU1NLY2_9BURK|nr:hypothetical protein [Variovorax soli]MDR6539465.1 hypothetical protein [Variovorax soli]